MKTVEVPVIKNGQDLDEALKRLEAMMERDDPAEDDEAHALMLIVRAYEDEHFPIGPSDPVRIVKFVMEQNGYTTKDLGELLGAHSRVSEFLNGKRSLTLRMVRRLNEAWKIPVDLLIPAGQTKAA